MDSAIYYSIYTTLVLLYVIDYEKRYLDMMAQTTVLHSLLKWYFILLAPSYISVVITLAS
jgi:hypothetical protein